VANERQDSASLEWRDAGAPKDWSRPGAGIVSRLGRSALNNTARLPQRVEPACLSDWIVFPQIVADRAKGHRC
jgi:hypothetical protein